MRAVRLALLCGVIFGLLCVLVALFFYVADGSWWLVMFLFGLGIGFVAAPQIDPSAFPARVPTRVFQALSGALAGGAIALVFQQPGLSVALLAVLGAVMGATAFQWVPRVARTGAPTQAGEQQKEEK